MIFHRQRAEGVLDGFAIGIARNTEDLLIIALRAGHDGISG
jgi:hypothetical protein